MSSHAQNQRIEIEERYEKATNTLRRLSIPVHLFLQVSNSSLCLLGSAGRGRSDEGKAALSRDARGTVGVRVSRVASKAGALSRRRGDKREGTVGRDALSAVRVGVGRVASEASDGGCRSDQGQRASSRDARGTVRVRVSWVAGEGCSLCSRCDESQGASGGDA
jgi:hypothetical protein